MAALVTDAEVKAVIDTTRDTTPFIDTADLLVTEDLANSGLSDARKKQIELYLAAHFVALTEERGNLTEHTVGDATEKYSMDLGSGLMLTRYGQQAANLDTSGTLKALASKGLVAQFRVI
jgi:hypothetical protein